MKKRKLTLTIRGDLLEEVKRIATIRGETLSSIVEEYFEYLALNNWIESLARELGLGSLDYVTNEEIVKSRPKGFDAARVVRELRSGRERRIFNG